MTDTFEPTPLIIDDDGSQDGMTAIAYMLANPKFDVQAITISNGIARPEVFDDNLLRMLSRLGDLDIPVGVGQSMPLEGNNEFPDFIRDGSDTFWSPFVSLPEETPDIETQDAVDLIIETIHNSPEPVAILATGPLTSIAEALRRDPSVIDNIEVVQIMGGAVFVEGNLPVLPDPPFSTNEVAEFNIWIDPVAAQEVFEAGERGLNIQLTPLDATNQIEFDREDYQEWLNTDTPESIIAAEFLDYALEIIQSDLDPNPVWDLVAAINLSEPEFSEETPLHIDVDTESDPGDTQGQTFAVDDLPPNVNVSLNPSFDNLPFDAGETFSYLELPVVSLSADTNAITEGGEPQLLTFHLSEPAPEGGLTVKLNIDDPDGEGADTEFPPELINNIVDFGQVEEDGVITASLTIAEGATEATFGISAIADDLAEGNETYSLTLLPDETYIADFDSTTITTTILEEDNMTSPTISLFAEPSEVPEGEQLNFVFDLSAPVPEGGLVVNLDLAEDTDPAPGDVTYFVDGSENVTDFELVIDEESGLIDFALVTLAEGATSATLVNDVLIDNVSEGDESATFALDEAEGYAIDPEVNEASYTLVDATEQPTISLFAEPSEVPEGEQLNFVFNLSAPVPEGGLVVNLDLAEDTDPAPGDVTYFVDGSENVTDFELVIDEESGLIDFALVTLAEGATSATLVNDVLIDNVSEGDESATFALDEAEGYAIDPEVNEASYTLVDTSTDLNISTSTSISFELDDLLVPARDAVVDVTFDLNYVSGIEDSEFLAVGEIADSIEDYLANNPAHGDFFEVITEDLSEFLVSDAGLGIGSVAESITVELDIEPNSAIPFPFAVKSTVELV